jgi:hypothetical protein
MAEIDVSVLYDENAKLKDPWITSAELLPLPEKAMM